VGCGKRRADPPVNLRRNRRHIASPVELNGFLCGPKHTGATPAVPQVLLAPFWYADTGVPVQEIAQVLQKFAAFIACHVAYEDLIVPSPIWFG
jgi:hypothetical protein